MNAEYLYCRTSPLNPITSYKHYLAASDPNVTPAHTANTAQFTAMRNHALSISELYFASNIVFSPLASIDDLSASSLVSTKKNVAWFHCGRVFFLSGLLTYDLSYRQGGSQVFHSIALIN